VSQPHFTDDQLQARLIELGFKVPRIVIFSWGKRTPCRKHVEGWVARQFGMRNFRGRGFPQQLAVFDVRIRQHLVEQWEGKAQ
jgi:hypothetical protein